MTKNTLIKNYRELCAATSYIMGFTFEKKLYMVEVNEIAPRYLSVETESQKNGGALSLRLRLKKDHKAKLAKNAICLGSEDLLTDSKYNKGEAFERLVTEHMGIEWKKDNIPFYKAGDISIDGKEIQVKLENATITNERAIKNARKALKAA